MPLKNTFRRQVFAPPFALYRTITGADVVDVDDPPAEATVPRIDATDAISADNTMWILVSGGAGKELSIWVELDGKWYLDETITLVEANESHVVEHLPAANLAITADGACVLTTTVTE